MITELRKAQDSWIAKGILALTALSFMSLFGISGYINRTADNPNVIKVNKKSITQADFNYLLDKEIKTAQRLFGENLEISDETRNALALSLAQRETGNLIVEETASKNNVYISDDMLKGVIYSQIQFRDENGRFDPQRFRYFLSNSGWSERQYIDTIRQDLKKQFLVQNPINRMNVPQILQKYAEKVESQRKNFKVITISDGNMKVNRQISQDEIDQYYEDFAAEFTVPEKRNVTVMALSFDDVAKATPVDDEAIEEYYKNNRDRFVTPETREVLQMMFSDEAAAKEAKAALDQSNDFLAVAEKYAGQNEEESNLDYVSRDMLLPELANEVFEADNNQVIGPLQSPLGWHILKVTNIKAGSKTDDKIAKAQIAETLRKENAYENTYELIAKIEDEIGAGKTLQELSKNFNGKLYEIKSLGEDGTSLSQNNAGFVQERDLTDAAFSYNQGEISQAVETENGIAFIQVDQIIDSHLQSKEAALPKIRQLWEDGEKAAIAQEIVNDVINDLENGDSIENVAKRYKLDVKTINSFARNDSFANLTGQEMAELFSEELNTPRVFNQGKMHIVAVATSVAEPEELNETQKDLIKRRLNLDILQQAGAALTNSYGNNYDVRIKYRLMGLSD